LLGDYEDDDDLLDYLGSTVTDLRIHYRQHYHGRQQSFDEPAEAAQATSSSRDESPSRVDFTARYRKKERINIDELEEYFKLKQENWDFCNPLEWWVRHRAQFPNLFCLARDILAIPGMSSSLLCFKLHAYFRSQVLPLLLSAFFPVDETQFPCDARVYNQRQSVP
jgi:hypothetical protein